MSAARPHHTTLAVLAFATLILGSSFANAHVMPAGRGTLNVVGSKAYIVVSIPVAAFQTVTACTDGVLTT